MGGDGNAELGGRGHDGKTVSGSFECAPVKGTGEHHCPG